MPILLFEHNQKAYDAVVSMLSETGKAAIVHPTGTGKSFIGFKLCEDNNDATICWLSPSEYIFKTQLENLAATGADVPENIQFFTYTKLMFMSEDDIAGIQPDYIVLDEFHRCGAEMWGKGVQNLLDMYDGVPILGLSATNIRYLDNQRDMADELFDGNIASEITLGEAIVRGILNPPTYVISVYSYQKDLDRYRQRIYRAKNKAVRDAAQKYLDELRRTLEKADGLDVIFQKHLTNRTGKYIVFCSGVEHMDEMISRVPEWFSGVDSSPHIYKAYSDDPETSKAFAEFKSDSSEHLKLLFCIDMLNEGVHVDGVSGVILFRPTVSPIVYKQQIGRALSVGKDKNAVILDVVNNFQNLYSIGAIEEEMQIAVNYYQLLGDTKAIVNERFRILDETQDAKRLFDELNDTLSASWDLMFNHAKQYYTTHGDLLPVQTYKTPEGYSLGQWLNTQRMARKGVVFSRLTLERIEKLDSIGMVWDRRNDYEWEKRYKALLKYHDKFGDIDVPYNYVTENGFQMGKWLSHLRQYKNAGIRNNILTPEREAQLNSLGMIWNALNFYWEKNYLAAAEFYMENGHLRIPAGYKSKNGLGIGHWIANMRNSQGKTLTEEQYRRMSDIGMCWGSVHDELWEDGFRHAERYFKEHGVLDASYSYKTDDGFNLGLWLSRQRKKLNIDRPDDQQQERIKRLNSIGMLWKKKVNDWETSISIAKDYFDEFGNIDIRQSLVYHDFWLGEWIIRQRKLYRDNALSDEQISELNALNMNWGLAADNRWKETYAILKAEVVATGKLKPADKNLKAWLLRQRKSYKNGNLTKEQITLLEEIGMCWELPDPWELMLEQAKEYAADNGNLDMIATYKTPDGLNLGRWLMGQRAAYRKGTLSANRIKQLESIGFEWESPLERQWSQGCSEAQAFYESNGHLNVPAKYESPSGFKLGVWLGSQRTNKKFGRLSEARIQVLDDLGINWSGTGNKTGVSLPEYRKID